MAAVRDEQCRGCGLRVLPHIVQGLRSETSEEVYRCECCGLILYALQPIPYTKAAARSAHASSPASTSCGQHALPRRAAPSRSATPPPRRGPTPPQTASTLTDGR